MLKILYITRMQRVAVLRNGRYQRLLRPGWHFVWALGVELVRFDLMEPVQTLGVGDPLPADAAEQRVISVREGQRVVVTIDGAQRQLLMPGRFRIWDVAEVELAWIDLTVEPAPLASDDRISVGAGRFVEASTTAKAVAVLTMDTQPVRALDRGRYRAWHASRFGLYEVSLALRSLEVAVQDLVTADQVAVRVKPVVSWRVADAVTFLREEHTAEVQVYAAVQLALREEVGARTLDKLLGERAALGQAILARARALVPDVGVTLEVAAVKDVILPGEVKDLLNKVTLARKDAEAQSIRRREEVAQTRQMANTAKLLERNPVLTRLKELEALGELMGKIDKITIVGTGDMVRDVLRAEVARD